MVRSRGGGGLGWFGSKGGGGLGVVESGSGRI